MNNNRMYTPLKFPNYLLYIWSPLFMAASLWGDICILITNVMVKKDYSFSLSMLSFTLSWVTHLGKASWQAMRQSCGEKVSCVKEVRPAKNHMREIGSWFFFPVKPADVTAVPANSLNATSWETLIQGHQVNVSPFLTCRSWEVINALRH